MRINRIAAVPASALIAVSALTACGSSDKATDTAKSAGSAAQSAGSSATDSASSGASGASSAGSSATSGSSSSSASDSSSECPTDNTRKFAKTRFTADVGLAAGTFHRWIYKPYQDGSFKKGQIDKSDAVKAAAVAAVDYKLLKNASENAKANPTLCKAVAKPLSDAMGKLKDVDTKQLLMGNVGGLMGAQSALSGVLSGSKGNGADVTENDNFEQAKKALTSN